MYIKLVRLKGFRTYKDLSIFSFSPGYNAIVGLNGSGKSNVFLAISFVLGENLPHLTKTNFLFKGDQSSLSSDFSAFVEVIFDVSDEPSMSSYLDDSKELSLQRTFSESRDVYMVNGKQMKHKEYREFLENINLISSDKSHSIDLHYVVMQGSVSKMSNISVEERLSVFRDIVGHKSFDIKIQESVKLLQDSTLTLNTLNNQFQQLSRKIKSLESQQKELQNWQDLDNKRKVLQCNLNLLKLKELENSFKRVTNQEISQNNLVSELEKKIESLDSELKQHKLYLESVSENSYDQKSNELNNLQIKFDEISNEINGLENEISTMMYNNEGYGSELDDLNENIKNVNSSLDILNPQIAKLSEEISKVEMEVNELLYKKSNKSNGSKPRKQNENLLAMIDKMENQKSYLTKAIKDREESKKRIRESLLKCEKDMKMVRTDLMKCEENRNKRLEAFGRWKLEMETCSENKRLKQKELSTEMLKLSKLKVNLLQAQENFKKVSFSSQQILDLINLWFSETEKLPSDKGTETGDESLFNIDVDHSHYVGLLVDIIKVKDEYKIAIEQVLGPKLFTIVVSDMSYAKSLVNFIETKRGKYLNVRIVSLDLLNESQQIMNKGSDCVVELNILPLKNCVEYQEDLDSLVNSLLKDFNLVPDSKTALKLLSKKQNSVTPTGEIFYYNGIVSGGYVNLSDSTLMTYKKLKNAQEDYNNTEKRIKVLNSQLDEINKKQEEIKVDYNNSKNEYNKYNDQYNSLTISLNNITNFEESLRMKLYEDKTEELNNQIKMINDQIKSFKEDVKDNKGLKQSMKSDEDEALDSKLEICYKTLSNLRNEKVTLDENKQQLENKQNSFTLKKNELSNKIITNNQMLNDYKYHVQELKQTLMEVEEAKNNLNQELANQYLNESLQKKIDDINLKVMNIENEMKQSNLKLQEETTKLKSITQLKSSISIAVNEYTSQLNSVDINIKENAESNMINDRNLVLDKLAKINKECSYLDHSVHISLKDCNELKDEFQNLENRKEQILSSKDEIYNTIKKLKSEKDKNLVELVQKTNFNITQIFQQLVPNGKIKLVLIKQDKANMDSNLPECLVLDHDEHFGGLDIKVSFSPNNQDCQINQLSGGQKTLVSLAFILSLKKLKHTPFYLLDEVDSALDDQYRTRLAKLLEKQSQNKSQIIVTTFREQLLKPAQVFYEITSENGISRSKEVTLSRAMEVIKQEPLPLTN